MAQLDTSIAFSGYVPNFANALASGAQAAAMRNEMTRQNALANVYQTQGAGILSGDQAALNALAGVGEVGQAIGVMDTRQGMDARALQMDATRQDMDIQMREWALRLDAAEREQRLAEGQQMLSGMIAASTSPQAWDAWAASTGQTQLIGQHGQSQTYIANLLPPLEALEMVQGQAAQRQERKVDSKAATEVNPDRYRNVEGVGLVDLMGQGGPQPVQFPGQATSPTADFGTVMDLRKEINGNPAVRNFIDISTAYNRIQSSAQVPSSAGDIALIFGFMKMLDPTSVVREGEFATAANSGGVDDTVRNLYNRVISGERLQPDQRAQFMEQAEAIYSGQRDQFKRTMNDYAGIAQRYGIPLQDVIVDYSANQPPPASPPPLPGNTPAGGPPPDVLPPPGPQPTLPPVPVPDQISTWTNDNLTAFLEANARAGRILPPEVWDAIMARSMQLNQQVQQ